MAVEPMPRATLDFPPSHRLLLINPATRAVENVMFSDALEVFREAGVFDGFIVSNFMVREHVVILPAIFPENFPCRVYARFSDSPHVPALPAPFCLARKREDTFAPPADEQPRVEFISRHQADTWVAIHAGAAGKQGATLIRGARAYAPPRVSPDELPPVRLTWRPGAAGTSATATRSSHFRTVWEALDFIASVHGISDIHSPRISEIDGDGITALLTPRQIMRIL